MVEYEKELERLREENNQIRFAKDLRERDFENVMFENAQLLNSKLLFCVFNQHHPVPT